MSETEAAYDFRRLERVVDALLERYRAVREENASLRRKLADQERRGRGLEAQILDVNQRRQDAAKRVDDLIAQIDHLDAQLGSTRE